MARLPSSLAVRLADGPTAAKQRFRYGPFSVRTWRGGPAFADQESSAGTGFPGFASALRARRYYMETVAGGPSATA